MKRTIAGCIATALISTILIGSLHAETIQPGQVDFGAFSPSVGADFAEVNVSS
jgi:hypothetical protein